MEYLPKIKREINPKEKANLLSKLFFVYAYKLFLKGYSRDLEVRDLYEVPSTLKSKKLGDYLEKLWMKQQKKSIIQVLLKCYGFYYFLLGLTQLVLKTILILFRPFLINNFVRYFQPNQTLLTINQARIYGIALVILLLGETVYNQWYTFKIVVLQIRVRVSLCSLFYRKMLKISKVYFASSGKIMTLITKDVYSLEMCIDKANDIWISIFQSFILMYLLFQKIGFVVLVPFIFFSVLLPLQVSLIKRSQDLKLQMLEEADNRFQLTKAVLHGIEVLKMYSWEKLFSTKVCNHREKEMQLTYTIFLLQFIIYINATLWTCVTFFPWIALHREKPSTETILFIFTTYGTINNLLGVVIPQSVCQMVQTFVTIKRTDEFLALKELSHNNDSNKNVKILLKDVTVTIKRETVLRNINLKFDKGLVLITGAVGSGKSFLLKTILGECELAKGYSILHGRISYSSQKPWLFASTIKRNILLGEKFDQKRYNQVLNVCNLIPDLQLLRNEDKTILEHGGINLSQGQLVKINLARAVYKNSDIYLLDDPLATLDDYTKDYIFENCIRTFLRDKLVLLVTQNPKLLDRYEHYFVILNKGEVIFSQLKPLDESRKIINDWSINFDIDQNNGDEENEESRLLPAVEKTNIFAESKKVGKVEYEVYEQWIKSGGGFVFYFLVIFFVVCLPLVSQCFHQLLNFWASNEENIKNYTLSNCTNPVVLKDMLNERKNIITLQIALILMAGILFLTSSTTFLSFAKSVSVQLHRSLIETVVYSGVDFFRSNSLGTILNRFSKDLLNAEEVIPSLFYDFNKVLLPIVVTAVSIVSTWNILMVPLATLLMTQIFLRKVYLTVSRSLKRLELSLRSPIVGYFNSTFDGLSTLRAQKIEQKLVEEFDCHQDLHTSASFMYLCNTRVFCLVLGTIYSVFFGIVVSQFLIRNSDSVDINLVTVQILVLGEILNLAILKWAEIENNMTSVERLLEYSQSKLENRQGFITQKWPKTVIMKYENVNIEPVLKNINFTIHPKEKIGIVGRTSSGKSSLISTLFRLHEYKGRILINDVDIKILSLELLRSNISVIPQDPIIFKGTIRDNIDPFQKHTDLEIRNALESVNLKKFIWDLDLEVFEGDGVFSVGQKQLLSLARVMLENTNVIVLDNVTANVDRKTKNLICDIIEKKFINSSMMVISYSLQVLNCCEKVMILDNGEILEFDKFSVLVQNKSEILFKIVNNIELPEIGSCIQYTKKVNFK